MIPSNRARLKRLFLGGFSALDVAEPLISFDFESSAFHAGHLLAELDFDAAGVRVAGWVAGYVLRDELKDGTCGGHLRPFKTPALLDENSTFADAIAILDRADRVFVKMLGPVGAIITRSDLQKPPARMWLFGLITILEMAFSELIDEHYEDNEWTDSSQPAGSPKRGNCSKNAGDATRPSTSRNVCNFPTKARSSSSVESTRKSSA